MANRRYIDFPIASSVGDSDILLIWQSGANKQTTKATFLSGLPENLDELNDVAISGLTNGQILRYDSVTGKWENTDQGNLDLNDLNDVSIVSPSNGQVLVYNSSTSRWENSSGGYVPYTGAVTTVNLGAQTIQAGSFVKAGGTAAQFLKANGSVDSTAYGTGSVTSVALTMPTAFTVGGSPITTAGTLAVTGAGTVGQYIRGDGSLADFPESSGGGSSVSYYLNGSVAQGTIGGVAYKELNKVPILGAGTDFTINADGYIASFITDAGDPNLLEIPAGNWTFETYFSASSGGGSPSFYVELYKVNSGGTATLIASNSTFPELIAFGTNVISYFSTLAVPTTALALTDRLAIRYYVTHSGRTITLHTEGNHLCQIITTFTTGITALNGLTAQIQNFAVGTSGTDFAISSATATHTFNLPTASATNRGALSSADWTTFNNKTSNLGTVTSVGLSSATSGVTIGSTPVTTSGTITLAIATASGSQNGLLSSTDWTTFNNKQNALTNPVTGTGTTNYLPKFTGANTIGNSLFTDDGTNGAFGGANYSVGTSVRTFNISAPLYPGLAFWANNQFTGSIFGYGATGNLFISADPTNIFADTKIVLSNDGTERFALFNDGNVTIANSPTNSGFKLDVNGTARFTSSITVGGTQYLVNTSTGTSAVYQRILNTGGDVVIGINSSLGNSLATGGLAYATAIYNNSNTALQFGTNAAFNMTIAAGGNVLIGTTTDNGAKLQVSGTATFSSSVAAQGFQMNGTGGYGVLAKADGINSAANGAYIGFVNNVNSRYFISQLDTNNDINYYYFNGASWSSSLIKLTNTGAGLFSNNLFAGGSVLSSPSGADTIIGAYGGQDCSLILQDAVQLWELYVNDDFYINRGSTNVLSLNRTTGAATFSSSVTSQVNNILADGAGVVLQGYVDNNLRIAVRGSGYNSGARGGLFASIGNFSGSVISNTAISLEAAGQNGISDGPYFRYLNTSNSYQILKQINANTDEDTWTIRGGGWNKVGTLNATTGVYTALSDKNKKKDFEDSKIGLNAILGLKPTLYRMKDQDQSEQKQLGFIAQEVKDYIPQAYIEQDNFIGLQDRAIMAALVKAIQEQQEIINDLKQKIQ